jgi:DNA replication and repair protein RecF
MILKEIEILNYKNIREGRLSFSPKLNCLVGLNGQGKTNVLDAIYLLSFTKSAFNVIDSQNITHGEEMSVVQGLYQAPEHLRLENEDLTITCGMKRGQKKQFRRGKKDYKRLIDHIGLIPLVMVSPEDGMLIAEGSDERRRFMDQVISQRDKKYLEDLQQYNGLVKQRNSLLKQYAEAAIDESTETLFEVIEAQMVPLAEYIHGQRKAFIEGFVPEFQAIYNEISGGNEQVGLRYVSQLDDRNLGEALKRTRQRDLILGWTSQGVHKDEIEMSLGEYPLKRVGSQGQQKTYLLAMKLATAVRKGDEEKPILLLDDIFDKLDSERVERIVRLVLSDRFGQIFITDTDRQHLSEILRPNENACIFRVSAGEVIGDRL